MNQAENKNTLDLVGQLKKHLKETSREQLEKEWKELEPYGKIGPTVDEYFNAIDLSKDEIIKEPKKQLINTIVKKYPLNKEDISKQDLFMYQQGVGFGFAKACKILEEELGKRIWDDGVAPMIETTITAVKGEKVVIPVDITQDFMDMVRWIIRDIYTDANIKEEYGENI